MKRNGKDLCTRDLVRRDSRPPGQRKTARNRQTARNIGRERDEGWERGDGQTLPPNLRALLSTVPGDTITVMGVFPITRQSNICPAKFDWIVGDCSVHELRRSPLIDSFQEYTLADQNVYVRDRMTRPPRDEQKTSHRDNMPTEWKEIYSNDTFGLMKHALIIKQSFCHQNRINHPKQTEEYTSDSFIDYKCKNGVRERRE